MEALGNVNAGLRAEIVKRTSTEESESVIELHELEREKNSRILQKKTVTRLRGTV